MKEDWFLGVIGGPLSEIGWNVGVTLCVNGILVSGTTISEEEYFDGIAPLVRKAKSPREDEPVDQDVLSTIAEAIGKSPDGLDQLVRLISDQRGEEVELEQGRDAMGNHIHLKDFYVNQGSGFNPYQGNFWRGKLEDINGFWIGVYQ